MRPAPLTAYQRFTVLNYPTVDNREEALGVEYISRQFVTDDQPG